MLVEKTMLSLEMLDAEVALELPERELLWQGPVVIVVTQINIALVGNGNGNGNVTFGGSAGNGNGNGNGNTVLQFNSVSISVH